MTPFERVDDWDDFAAELYLQPEHPEPAEAGGRRRDDYRDFAEPSRDTVRELYRLNHRGQTWNFIQEKKAEYLTLDRAELPPWEALEFLNTLVDDSDPDAGLSQLDHLLQTAEAIRADGCPDWFVLTGLVHDLGQGALPVERAAVGPWSATPFRSAARSRTGSCIRSWSPRTRTPETRATGRL